MNTSTDFVEAITFRKDPLNTVICLQHIQSLDRGGKQATFRAKQERYRQSINRYNERMRTKKAGTKPPKRPTPHISPQLN